MKIITDDLFLSILKSYDDEEAKKELACVRRNTFYTYIDITNGNLYMGAGAPKKYGEKYVAERSSLESYGDSVDLENIKSFLEQINNENNKMFDDTDYVSVYKKFVEKSNITKRDKAK